MKTAALVLVAALSVAASAAAEISVRIDQVRRLSFSGSAADVVVGNPDVAEVTVVDGRNVFVTGRTAGVTDVVVLDGAGRIVLNQAVRVGREGDGGLHSAVTISRGSAVTTLICNPRCEDASPSTPPAAVTVSAAAPPAAPALPATPAAAAAATAPPGSASSGSSD